MRTQPHVSIIVPAYKEEANIAATLREMLEAFPEAGFSFEILVVVDGSPDGTEAAARTVEDDRVRVLAYKENQGKGYALCFGTNEARGKVVTFADAGGDFAPVQFARAIQLLELFDADMVVGSKWHPASKVTYPLLRRIYSRVFHLFTRIFLQVRVTDTQTGLKFLKAEVAKDLMPRLLVKRYAFDLELIVVAEQLGYHRIFEVPVDLNFNTAGSGINFSAIAKMMQDTLAIFYRARIINYYRKQG